MAAHSEGFIIVGHVLWRVSDDYIKGNNGCFEFPYSVTTIRPWAFAHCSRLKKITIHDSVTTVEEIAFDGCPKDLVITIRASEPSEEEAQALKGKLQKNHPSITIHIKAFGYYMKGNSSSPSFFSLSSNLEGGEPPSNNQHKPGA